MGALFFGEKALSVEEIVAHIAKPFTLKDSKTGHPSKF